MTAEMTAYVRFDYFIKMSGRFLKSETKAISFKSLQELQDKAKAEAQYRQKLSNTKIVFHIMTIVNKD